ncbi:hypothetical protein B0T26DRAFT_649535 [Lasiosphaeria miniovina]|uniref:Uncharacterized protein n=1 Tax=Lasiosphaeria miniovina TaxID=1954250 RepID=A0AA40DVS6_9PEZI|nr:uncharacterized protein B0T26DRAFT_649535 [Lasiosphaeria miniovina]KAK0713553.1 hypothetical protein B0T26DRAFT_649535 [Lasiosphaeria miniovina]
MPFFNARDIISMPGGDNSSDTLIGNVHFNKTTLDFWNYTLYSNNTLSNGSWCILTFPPYTPSLVEPNGTFVNVTYCYSAVNPIGLRSGIGVGFAALFGLMLIPTLVNLNKHGKLYLPAERRFQPVGRRWQWYWGAIVSATALISLLTNIDVDRYYLPELPIVLTSFFWYIMQMCSMALVWEAVRHWGSWMERQFIDPNPFILPQNDKRSNIEFWLPLVFYFWLWLNFFLIVPRNWGRIELQRYPQQIIDEAIPAATDGRFKAAAFVMVVCWLIIAFFLRHAIKHYKERNRGIINRFIGLIRFMPIRFRLLLPLAAVIPTYQAMVAWEFSWSPMNVHGNNAAIYGGGYAPSLLILVIQAVSGFMRPNEDRELQRQRRERGTAIDREIGITHKPAWWQRARADFNANETIRERIARNVREVGGGKATARNLDHIVEARSAREDREQNNGAAAGESVEMDSMPPRPLSLSQQATDLLGPIAPGDFERARNVATLYGGRSERRRTETAMAAAAGVLFPAGSNEAAAAAARRRAEITMDGPPPPPYADRGRQGAGSRSTAARSNSTETINSINQPPQQIKSMLDV